MNRHDLEQWWNRFLDSGGGCGVMVAAVLLVMAFGGILGFLLGRW